MTEHVGAAGLVGSTRCTTSHSLSTKSRTHRILSRRGRSRGGWRFQPGLPGRWPGPLPPALLPGFNYFVLRMGWCLSCDLLGCVPGAGTVAQVQVPQQARALRLGGVSPSRGRKGGPQKTRLSSKLWDLKMWPSWEEGSLQM